MEYALALPSYRAGASAEAIDAATAAAARLGWQAVFTTDHVLVDTSRRAADYAVVFDPLITLAHVAARVPSVRIGISVVVVPMRNAVVLAKELATLDVLSAGRLIVGVGVGWNRNEFANLGAADRFGVRGAYLDEAIELWRHLWGNGEGPFKGRFHQFDEVRFGPLPVQGASVPIWVGGAHEAALRRAGRLGDGYHSSAAGPAQLAVRIPVVRAAAADAGRPAPLISARLRVEFGAHEVPWYVVAGTPEQMLGELRAFAELGVDQLTFDFVETDPVRQVALMERFHEEVLSLLE
ncbi:MAG TPA: TIGR03619 family F420-dependent LLM class oxidoreductase [Candidatus Limnocylindria bacterium]|jgi:probable F420-dependent oxidoreductase|nr:TIGR03619 family F420-dependent LLM class oxidoreductase [Candidatus Limnocylindria bacterium]